MEFKELKIEQLDFNPFEMIGGWALLASGKPDNFNMMTVSWGQAGVLWNKNVVTAYVRPQRYTKGFMDTNDIFTLNFFDADCHDALSLCGSKSGRDVDKMNKSGLTAEHRGGAVLFTEAKLILVCEKLYIGQLEKDGFLDEKLVTANYQKADFHTFYIGEIKKILSK
ncbi:MAG TPA: flavin reductase [Oscillospiraceae bacterium]|nr:flavin reductase [Oscillospiraceae bacterium]HPF55451.1 flavin reductase [Clostridiales bacterium]HPK36235.1 flavin reductase [Oscillospiraceae bacterium]HPR75497.1 flavin reductase [Oscillospiraceae bacterium]